MFSFEWSERLRNLHDAPFEAYDGTWKKQNDYFEKLKNRHFKCLDDIRKVRVHCRHAHPRVQSLDFEMRTKVDERWKWLNQCY